MGARRTLGRTVGESAVEVSSSRSGRVSSSSSILGPILACSVPRLSGKGGAIVAAKKYRPARSNSSPAHSRHTCTLHTCGSFKLKSIRVNTFWANEKGARRLGVGTHSASARASHPLSRVPGARESRRTSPGAPVERVTAPTRSLHEAARSKDDVAASAQTRFRLRGLVLVSGVRSTASSPV